MIDDDNKLNKPPGKNAAAGQQKPPGKSAAAGQQKKDVRKKPAAGQQKSTGKSAAAGKGTGPPEVSKTARLELNGNVDHETMGMDAALSIADDTDDAALKKLHEQIPPDSVSAGAPDVGLKEAPEAYRFEPEDVLGGRKAVKGSFDSAPSVLDSPVSNADVYADVTARVLAARADEADTKEEPPDSGPDSPDGGKAGRKKRAETGPPAGGTAPPGKQKQALGDYRREGAVNDAVAQNEAYLRAKSLSRRKKRILTIVILILLLLFLFAFGISAIANSLRGFTVSLTGTDMAKGLTLYSSLQTFQSGEDGTSKLTTGSIPECDNQTYSELKDNILTVLDLGEGEQSRIWYYFAYSFYLANVSPGEIDYEMRINMTAASKGVDDAVRIALIEDSIAYGAEGNTRVMSVAGKPAADPETGAWLYEPDGVTPKMQKLIDPDGNEYPPAKQDNAVPFYSPSVPVYRKITRFKGAEHPDRNLKKYTVVIWLEGGDPDCLNNIKGGGIKFNAEFTVTDYRIGI